MGCFSRHRYFERRWAACGLCLGIAATQLAAQTPTLKTRTKEQRDREYLEAHRITLNVQVADSNGKLVPDLTAADFSLFDNGQAHKIVGMHMIDGEAMSDATTVVILLDAVNTPAKELEEGRQAIFNYLAHGRGQLPYPTAFVLWSNGELKATSPTVDRNTLGRAFVKATKGLHSNACSAADGSQEKIAAGSAENSSARKLVGSGDGAGQNEANCLQVHFRDSIAALDGIAQQHRTNGGRTILIWVGSGWPLLSGAEFGQPSPKARAGFFDELTSVLHDLRDSQMTIDAVSPQDGVQEKELERIEMKSLLSGMSSSREAGPANLALPILASVTGGRASMTSNDLESGLRSCIRDADAYYAVMIEAMPATSPHEFHKIEMKVKRPGLEVRTMSAYYAEP
jgi:VWFA-related protein